MTVKYLAPLVVVVAMLAGCATHSKADGDTKYSDNAKTAESKAQLTLLWKDNSSAGFKEKFSQFQPAYVADNFFVADSSGKVQSFDANGKAKWKVKVADELSAGVGVGDGLVVVGTYLGEVIAVDELDGHIAWRKSVGSEVLAAPAVAEGVVVIHAGDERIIALEARSGTELWTYDGSSPTLSLRGSRQPLIENGYAVVGFSNGRASVFQLQTGRKVWEYSVALPQGRNELQRVVNVQGHMVIENNVLYATAYNGRLVAVQMSDSTPIWEHDVASASGVTVGPGAVYVADDQGVIWAFDKLTGKELWKQEGLVDKQPTAPTLSGAYLAVGDNTGHINLIALADGHILSSTKIDKYRVFSAPLVAKDNFVVYTQGGTLAALAVK